VGIPAPQVTVRGINDVPIVVLTLTPKPGAPGQWNDAALFELTGKLRTEVAKVDDVGLTFIVGGQRNALRVVPDPARLAVHQVPLGNVIEAVSQANRTFPVGTVRESGQAVSITAGQTLRSAEELGQLTVRSASGAPVLLTDVASVVQAPTEDQARAMALGPQRREPMGHGPSRQPRHRQARRGQRRDSIGISSRTDRRAERQPDSPTASKLS
jgi:multidrug efflux pump subunit AcrB